MISHKCSECSLVTKRSDNLKRHMKNVHGIIKEDNVYKIDKILKTRKRQGKTDHLVHWKGYPSSFDSWKTDLVNFQWTLQSV